MARFLFADHPYFRISDMMAALGLPNNAFRVVDGVLRIEGVDQTIFDEAIQALDPLGALRDATIAVLEQACSSAIVAGIDYKGVRVPTCIKDQLNLVGLCLAAVNGKVHGKPFSSKFWVKSPKWIRQEFSGDELVEIGESVMGHVQECQAHYAELLQQVETAETAAQLLALHW